jgi:hypothetical protein
LSTVQLKERGALPLGWRNLAFGQLITEYSKFPVISTLRAMKPNSFHYWQSDLSCLYTELMLIEYPLIFYVMRPAQPFFNLLCWSYFKRLVRKYKASEMYAAH